MINNLYESVETEKISKFKSLTINFHNFTNEIFLGRWQFWQILFMMGITLAYRHAQNAENVIVLDIEQIITTKNTWFLEHILNIDGHNTEKS